MAKTLQMHSRAACSRWGLAYRSFVAFSATALHVRTHLCPDGRGEAKGDAALPVEEEDC